MIFRSRRQILGALGAASLGTFAGCAGLPNQFHPRVHNEDAEITTTTGSATAPWPTLGHDGQRTNATLRSGPSTDASLSKLRDAKTFPQTQPILTAEQVVFPGVVEKQTLKPDNDEFGHRFEAVALDSNDTVWTLETSVHPAPALVAGRTAFCPFDGNVVAVDIRDGSIFWRYAAGSGLDTGSPAMVDETLYVPDRRSITTLNAVTGRKRWKADRVFDGNVLGVAVAEDLLLASGGTSEDPLLAFDRRTGEVAWSVPAAGKSIPVIDGDAVFVMDSRQLAARAVTDGSQLWTRGDVDDSHRPAVADGTIYTPSEYANGRRELLAIDTATGETQWRSRIGPKVLTGPPVVGAESVFVQTGRDGQVLIIAYDRTTGNRRWEQTARLGVTDALVLGDNALYFLGQPDNAAEVNTGAVYVIE